MFINIGYGNYVNSGQILSISRFDSAPMKRLVQNLRESGRVVDETQGRKTKSVIMTEGGYLVLSALLPDTIAGRYQTHSSEETEETGGQEDA